MSRLDLMVSFFIVRMHVFSLTSRSDVWFDNVLRAFMREDSRRHMHAQRLATPLFSRLVFSLAVFCFSVDCVCS